MSAFYSFCPNSCLFKDVPPATSPLVAQGFITRTGVFEDCIMMVRTMLLQ